MRRKDRDLNSSPKRKSSKNSKIKQTANSKTKQENAKRENKIPVFPLSDGLIAIPFKEINNKCRFGSTHICS